MLPLQDCNCDSCRRASCYRSRFCRSSSRPWSSGSCWPSPCLESLTCEDFSPRKPTGKNMWKVSRHARSSFNVGSDSSDEDALINQESVSSHRSEGDDPQGGRQLSRYQPDCSVVNKNSKLAALGHQHNVFIPIITRCFGSC